VHDRELREALHHKLLKEHHGDTNTLVLDELGLRHGTCRVDIAVVNGYLHGYEIKSDADTLQRLPGQVSVYCAVLDRATLVVGEKHAEKAKAHLPDWWGLRLQRRDRTGASNSIRYNFTRPTRLLIRLLLLNCFGRRKPLRSFVASARRSRFCGSPGLPSTATWPR